MNPRDWLFDNWLSNSPKFKVGDKVRVTKQDCKFSDKVVEVIRVRPNGFTYNYEVKAFGSNERSSYNESSLEAYVEPKSARKPLEVGDRVELNHVIRGLMQGTVKRAFGNNFEVLFDDGTVDKCPQSRLTLIVDDEREEVKMAKLTGFNKIAVINFGGYKDYDYALYDDTVVKGDMVVVSGNAENQLVEVEDVVEVTPTTNTDHITAEVIAKVDMTAYNKRVEDRQRKAELMRLMDKKIAEAKEVDKYAEYAKFLGDDFAKMFEEFKSL